MGCGKEPTNGKPMPTEARTRVYWRALPCPGCNMIAFDAGIHYDEWVKAGAIKNGEQVLHLNDCPFAHDAYPRVTGKQVLQAMSDVLTTKEARKVKTDNVLIDRVYTVALIVAVVILAAMVLEPLL